MKERTSRQILRILKAVFAVLSVAVVGAEGELADPDAGTVTHVLALAWLLAGAVSCWEAVFAAFSRSRESEWVLWGDWVSSPSAEIG